MPHLDKTPSSPSRISPRTRSLSLEPLETRLLLTAAVTSSPLLQNTPIARAGEVSTRRTAPLPYIPVSTALPTAPRATPLPTNTSAPIKRDRPHRPLLAEIHRTPPTPQAPDGQTLLTPPSLPGSSKTVELSIGNPTGKTAQPLGVNIGSLTAYAQGNVTTNMITQGAGFELSDGRVLLHAAMTGSTSNQLVADGNWFWDQIGSQTPVGQTLVGSTGININRTFQITAMAPQLDSAGNPTGKVIFTIAGTFLAPPEHADSFYLHFANFAPADAALANKVDFTGNAAIARDTTTARSGQSSAALTFGTGSGNSVKLSYYFGADNTAGRNILQQGHTYQLSFWAKTTSAGSANLSLYQYANGGSTALPLIADGQWHQYLLNVTANSLPVYQNAIASIQINSANGKVNLDDVKLVDLSDQISPTNPLSKEIVDLIKSYHFGDLRFWIPELRFASLDALIGSPESRPMIVGPGTSYDPQLGLPEMLELSKETNAAAWLTLPTTWSATDMHNLMEYLAGDASTPYGAKRIADGHAASWFSDLPGLYLEAGNESWNGIFAPNAYYPFEPYFARAQDMFHAVKTDPLYAANAAKIQLVVNGWQAVPWFTQQAVLNTPDADAVDVAAYTTGPSGNVPLKDLLGGALSVQQSVDPTTYPPYIFGKKVYVYEESIGELGTIPPAVESAYATSLGAGLSVLDNAMTLTRDYGMSTQNLFTLMQRGDSVFGNYILGYYGLFTDLTTAQTNPRPIALGTKLLNNAQGQVLSTSLSNTGWTVDPTSSIPGAATAPAATAMVTFDGHNLVFTFFNKTLTDLQNTNFHFTLPTLLDNKTFSADWAHASFTLLTGPAAASNNEPATPNGTTPVPLTPAPVQLSPGTLTHTPTEAFAALPPHSMASLVIPINF